MPATTSICLGLPLGPLPPCSVFPKGRRACGYRLPKNNFEHVPRGAPTTAENELSGSLNLN